MMTPTQLKKARHALGLSAEGFACLVGVKSGRTVRRWESGEREIPGPVFYLLAMIQNPALAKYTRDVMVPHFRANKDPAIRDGRWKIRL
jgi:DNA-binding transcriptional regulator YiaG